MVAGSDPLVPEAILHASCVALADKAVLIRGASGSGKSALALELITRGAKLVADDRTCLSCADGAVFAFAPQSLLGMIEARCVGILKADPAPPTQISLVVDMDQVETDRLPPERSCDLLGQELPLLHKVASAHFPAAVTQYLLSGPWIPK